MNTQNAGVEKRPLCIGQLSRVTHQWSVWEYSVGGK